MVLRASVPVEIFIHTHGGGLTGSGSPPPSSVNLTTEGTADWAHWGRSSTNIYDHKAGVMPQISNYTKFGSPPVTQYNNNLVAYSWTDGTPTSTASGTDTGIYFAGYTNGFQLTAPADTTIRRLKVYVSVYGAQGNFQAFLSDASVPPFLDTSLDNVFGDSYAVYTLDYAAASAGQKLTVRFRTQTIYDYDFGNVTLQAVTLNGASIPLPTPVTILNPTHNGSDFSFSFATQSGRSYTAQHIDVLGLTNWQTFTNFTGSGAMTTVSDKNLPAAQRFYRVGSQ